MTIRQKNLLLSGVIVVAMGNLTACGGSDGNKDINSAHQFVSSSSVTTNASSSSSLIARQEIEISKDIFFKEPGLWLAFTNVDATERFPQNDVQKPFREDRLRETSINTYIFASETENVAPGVCVRTPSEFDTAELLPAFVGSELYCITKNRFFRESDNSYTMEYRCENELVMTTRIMKLSDQRQFQDFGLTLNGAQVQQPACASWNISTFESWSLDKDGKEVVREGRAAMLNKIFIRTGIDNNSKVITFTRHQEPISVGVFNIGFTNDLQPQFDVEAEVSTANASLPFIPGIYFPGREGELRVDAFTPLMLSGSFNMQDAVSGGSLGGSFSFDFSQYFKEIPVQK